MHPDSVVQDDRAVLLFDRSVDSYEDVYQWLVDNGYNEIVNNAHSAHSSFGYSHKKHDTVFIHYYDNGCIGCCSQPDKLFKDYYYTYNVTLKYDIMAEYLKEAKDD